MLAGAVELDIDSNGRILIPDFLREYAELADKSQDKTANKVVFAGVHSRVEVWNELTWKEYKSRILKSADQLAQKLGDIGVI
jgi:MraZ protein